MQVTMVVAITADGKVDREGNTRSFDWTTKDDKKFYIESIKRSGVVVCGYTTFKSIRRFPPGLKYYVYTSKPEVFVNHRPDIIEAIPTKQEPVDLLKEIEKQGYDEVSISGGASIYTMFLKEKLIDKIYLSVEPIMFGKGVGLLKDIVDVKLKLLNVSKLGEEGTALLEYKIVR